jgi:hypothetical protein
MSAGIYNPLKFLEPSQGEVDDPKGIFAITLTHNNQEGAMITRMIVLTFLGFVLAFSGCDKPTSHPDAARLSVAFSWEGMKPCGWGNPEIHVDGVPAQTKFLIISMFDHAYKHDHGTVTMPFAGERTIARDRFKAIQGPCPSWSPGQYEITIKAVDEKETVIAIGRNQRPFPENE